MTADDLERYLTGLEKTVEIITGVDGQRYTVIRGYKIETGSLAGTTCDVALLRPSGEPYVMASAIHTCPHLLPMNTAAPLATQASPIGPAWQYWSRRYD